MSLEESGSLRAGLPHGELTPKHRIRYTLRLPLWERRWLRLNLTPRRRRNRAIRRAIGDALECVCNSRQLKRHLVRSARPLHHDNPFPAEVKSSPGHQPNHYRYTRHERIVTCNCKASTPDSDYVIQEQSFLPVGANGSPACTLTKIQIGEMCYRLRCGDAFCRAAIRVRAERGAAPSDSVMIFAALDELP
jgi:hypothetical protein